MPRRWPASSRPGSRPLHLIASSRVALPITALSGLGRKGTEGYGVDWRSLWRLVTAGLLSKGVALAVDRELPPLRGMSRLAGYELLLPAGFHESLPPFPIETRPFAPSESPSAPEDLLTDVLCLFVRGGETGRKGEAKSLAVRLVKLLSITDGILAFGGNEPATDERVQATVAETWQASLESDRSRCAPRGFPLPGRVVAHLLEHLPPGSASSVAAVKRALEALGLPIEVVGLETFLADGAVAGLLQRSSVPGAEPCYRAAPERSARTPRLKLVPAKEGVLVDPMETDLLPLLQAAALCRVSLEGPRLRLVPDPIRMGRALRQVPDSLVSRLTAASPAIAAAVREVEAREGRVVVHSGLSVFRVEDRGLLALFLARFPGAVRELPDGFLACLSSEQEALLTLARKEGYVARRAE